MTFQSSQPLPRITNLSYPRVSFLPEVEEFLVRLYGFGRYFLISLSFSYVRYSAASQYWTITWIVYSVTDSQEKIKKGDCFPSSLTLFFFFLFFLFKL
jgi:hypothetical protein